MAKQHCIQDFDEITGTRPTSTHLRIRGLKAVPGESELFEMQGVRPRLVKHELLAEALGYEAGSDPELEDKILREVFKFDMIRLLTDRMVL
tara:strand:- start:27715 stop:27987 length:273 start_codon:yes stop_codon:yes gene_type:complete